MRKRIRFMNEGSSWVGQESAVDFMQAACQMIPSYIPCDDRQEFGLTARERQIITLVGAGCTDRDLAQMFGISENTARDHVANLFDKLGVSNRIELLLLAAHQGLTEVD